MTRYRCRWWQRHLWSRWDRAGSWQFRRCNACGKYGVEAL